MRMKVVPDAAKVQVEEKPTQALTRFGADGRSVTDVGSTVEAVRCRSGSWSENDVVSISVVVPVDGTAWAHLRQLWIEHVLLAGRADHVNVRRGSSTGYHLYLAGHRRTVYQTVIRTVAGGWEGLRVDGTRCERGTLEMVAAGRTFQWEDEQRNAMIGRGLQRVEHDERSE